MANFYFALCWQSARNSPTLGVGIKQKMRDMMELKQCNYRPGVLRAHFNQLIMSATGCAPGGKAAGA
jgi:hypothetical protein